MSKRVFKREEVALGNLLLLRGNGASPGGPAADSLSLQERLAHADRELARIQGECVRLPLQARAAAAADKARVLAAAKTEAERLAAAAQAEAAAIREAARQEGHAAGMAAGRAEALGRVTATVVRIEALVAAGQREHERLIAAAEPTIVTLAVELARRILKDAVAVDTEVVVRNLREALTRVREKGGVRIYISARDHAALQTELGDFLRELKDEGHTVMADPAIEPGGGRVETEYGTIDATLATQLASLRESLLVAAAAGTATNG